MDTNFKTVSSHFSTRFVLGFIFNGLLAIGSLSAGIAMIFYLGIEATERFFGSLIFVWLGLFGAWNIFISLEKIVIEKDKIIIRKLYNSTSLIFSLKDASYNDYSLATQAGTRTGIFLKSSDNIVISIGSKVYSNSDEIISYIKNHCTLDKNIKTVSHTLLFRLFFVIGILIFILIIIFVIIYHPWNH